MQNFKLPFVFLAFDDDDILLNWWSFKTAIITNELYRPSKIYIITNRLKTAKLYFPDEYLISDIPIIILPINENENLTTEQIIFFYSFQMSFIIQEEYYVIFNPGTVLGSRRKIQYITDVPDEKPKPIYSWSHCPDTKMFKRLRQIYPGLEQCIGCSAKAPYMVYNKHIISELYDKEIIESCLKNDINQQELYLNYVAKFHPDKYIMSDTSATEIMPWKDICGFVGKISYVDKINREEIFKTQYNDFWGKYKSGLPTETVSDAYIAELNRLKRKILNNDLDAEIITWYNVGCGKHCHKLSKLENNYIGIDIVTEIIDENKNYENQESYVLYEKENFVFYNFNTKPSIVIIRDVLRFLTPIDIVGLFYMLQTSKFVKAVIITELQNIDLDEIKWKIYLPKGASKTFRWSEEPYKLKNIQPVFLENGSDSSYKWITYLWKPNQETLTQSSSQTLYESNQGY